MTNLLAAAVVLLLCLATTPRVVAQTDDGDTAARAGEDEVPGLSESEEARVEQELMHNLPVLAPIGDPKRIAQLWELSAKLTSRRAYCRAAQYLRDVEKLAGSLKENKAGAAQAFYMCARTRLAQGSVTEAADNLQRSMNIVGNRPEHRDMLFKMAIVRAKQGIARGDLEVVRRSLEEARQIGIAMGPGGKDRLARWAVPIVNETVKRLSVWSRDLLDAGDRELADQASKLAIELNPRDRIAESVRRDLVLGGFVLPVVGLAFAAFMGLGGIYWWVRWARLRRVSREDI